MPLFGRKSEQDGDIKLVFATDLHGSTLCFRKLITFALQRQADVVVMGGDICGKAIVPVVEDHPGHWEAEFYGTRHEAHSESERDAVLERLSNVGFYGWVASPEQAAAMQSAPADLDALFDRLMVERLESWWALAEKHWEPQGIRVFAIPGNDDKACVDPVFSESRYVQAAHNQVLPLDADGRHELASCGDCNMTPWHCPRDLPEDEYGKRVDSLLSQVRHPETAVYNIHCPPFDSKLDQAPAIDKDQRMVAGPAGGRTMPVGSPSVRAAIERTQPLLSLHGHIHESRGVDRLGRTLAVNPGSSYNDGVLRCAFIRLGQDKVRGFQLFAG